MTSVDDASHGACCPPQPNPGPCQAQRAVLVVDDEEALLHFVQSALGDEYHVFCAQSTSEAEALLLAHSINVIVCDHIMPGENGLNFLMRLRQTHPLVSRILLTGCTEPEAMLTAINQSSVHRYLIKPISLQDLRDAVADALRVHDSERRHAGLGKENADLRSSLHKLLSRSASLRESPTKLLAVSSLGLLALLAAALLLGLLVFVVLYALKSALGIDFFPNWSHSGVL